MPKKVILIIEDEEIIRYSLTELLGEEYIIKTACHGKEAIEYLKCNTAPDLIMLDFMMPVMNGLEFINEARKLKLVDNVPVILLSADSLIGEEYGEFNGYHYIKKPFQIDHLMQMLKELIKNTS